MRKIVRVLIILSFLGCVQKNTQYNEKGTELKSDYKMIVVSQQATFSGPLALMKSRYDTLFLSQTDMKCGEFGGDTVQFKIYGNQSKSGLLLEYKKISIECAENQNPVVTDKRTIEIKRKERIIIQDCILELTLHKLSSEQIISNFGIRNTIFRSDSSIVIKDWPSFEWPKFNELVEIIIEQ